MAEKLQSTLIKSSLGVDKIKKSVMTFRKSINSTQKSAVNINTALVNSNRQKQQAIKLTVSNFQRRREAVRRREREDVIEASGISGAIRRQGKVIASSTKGFLGRILDFIGTLMVGWLINNLPVIIRLGEQLIDRMGKLFVVLRSFVGNVTTILSGFGSLLGGTIQNFMKFDFTDQQQLIDNSMSTIQTGILGIEKDFNDAIYLLSQPLDLGFDTLYNSSVLLLNDAQHLNSPLGFFSLSFNIAAFTPQLFPSLLDTLPSQGNIFNLVTSTNVAFSPRTF